MRLDQAVRNLAETRKAIQAHDIKYENTGQWEPSEASDLLSEAHRAMTDVIESWDN